MKADRTTKRLLSAMMIGVGFAFADGHRWIVWHDALDNVTLKDALTGAEIYPTDKVYGSIMDCLDYIDYLCKLVGWSTLETRFDKYQDWEYGKHYEDEEIWKEYNKPSYYLRR